MADNVSVSREIAAPADEVWVMVADVTRMGEWSPENEAAAWIGGASSAAPGARFRSVNRNGQKSWKTVGTVVEAVPGSTFSFHVKAGPIPVSDWSYTFEPTDAGCRVTETWTERRPGFFKPIAQMATGVKDRVSHNRQGMETTLERLAATAEAESPSS